ncbi:MAG: triose-phosphate isomerase, partial [Thermoguttaceae bacterium]
MRRPFVAGNWKMNMDRASAVALAEAVAKQATSVEGVEIAVCPPFVYLEAVGKALAGSKVVLGAQN